MFPAPSRRSDDLSVPGACKAGRRWFWYCLKWACRGNTEFRISRMSSFSFVICLFHFVTGARKWGSVGF